MRIGTWNVAYGAGGRNRDRRAILLSKDADVWVLTETNAALDLGGEFVSVGTEPRQTPDKGSLAVFVFKLQVGDGVDERDAQLARVPLCFGEERIPFFAGDALQFCRVEQELIALENEKHTAGRRVVVFVVSLFHFDSRHSSIPVGGATHLLGIGQG